MCALSECAACAGCWVRVRMLGAPGAAACLPCLACLVLVGSRANRPRPRVPHPTAALAPSAPSPQAAPVPQGARDPQPLRHPQQRIPTDPHPKVPRNPNDPVASSSSIHPSSLMPSVTSCIPALYCAPVLPVIQVPAQWLMSVAHGARLLGTRITHSSDSLVGRYNHGNCVAKDVQEA